ncbi:MAG: MarR family transcriptional regulator [Pseudomonadota bacterium]
MAGNSRRSRDAEKDLIDTLIDQWRRERPDLDAKALGVVGRILMIGRRLENRASATLKAFDLHYSDFDVLATLRRSGAPYELTPKELMQSVLITSGAMTALLDRLSSRNLITRGQSDHDGRVRTAILTDEGKALIDKAVGARFEEARDAIAGLSAERQRGLANDLREIAFWLDSNEK